MKKHQKFLAQHRKDEPPINVEGVIEGLGIEIFKIPCKTLAGMYTKTSKGSYMLIDSNSPKTRQRFTMAHELKHYLEDECSLSIDKAQACIKEELEANDFAGHLLVPSMWLSYYYAETKGDVTKMAKIFHVSPDVIRIRLQQLGL